MSRMEKYENLNKVSKRTSKNVELYQDLKDYTSMKEEIIVDEIPLVEVDLSKEKKKRVIKNQDIVNKNSLISIYKTENKEYDINKVIDYAKKNRVVKDELEEKRNLDKDEYNITKNIDLKKIDEFKESKKKEVLNDVEKEELKELIHTIYSNNLKEEIKKEEEKLEDKDLFSDLMASNDETIIDEHLAGKMIEEEKKILDAASLTGELKNIDDSFFSKSLELNRKDFDDIDTSFVEEKNTKKTIIIIIITIILLLVIGIIVYSKFFNI